MSIFPSPMWSQGWLKNILGSTVQGQPELYEALPENKEQGGRDGESLKLSWGWTDGSVGKSTGCSLRFNSQHPRGD